MTRMLLLFLSAFFLSTTNAQGKLRKEKILWIPFQWNDPDAKDAILLETKFDTLPYKFNWQLDTGSPYTFMYGATWQIFLLRYPYLLKSVVRTDTVEFGNYHKIQMPQFEAEGKPFLPDTILINEHAGGGFPTDFLDKYKGFGIGTIGLDIFRNKVLVLDFKNLRIGFGNELSKSFYRKKLQTSMFTFYKNRIIVPIKIGDEKFPFFYDCGASMFSLQTTSSHSRAFAPSTLPDTLYNINNGETGTVHNVAGGTISKPVVIAGKVYQDVKVYVEPEPSPIFDEARVAGLLGNKLFLNSIVVIDFRNKKFTVLN